MPTKARAKMLKATYQPKTRFKLYKKGHTWVIAGMTLLFSGILTLQQPQATHAATTDGDNDTVTSATGVDTTTAQTVTLTPATVATIGSQTITAGDSVAMPSVTMAAGEVAPDWTMSDFDFSQVDTTTVGTYTVSLSAAGLARLQAANPSQTITASHTVNGTVTVKAAETVPSNASATAAVTDTNTNQSALVDAVSDTQASESTANTSDSSASSTTNEVAQTTENAKASNAENSTDDETNNTADGSSVDAEETSNATTSTTPQIKTAVDAVVGPVTDSNHKVTVQLSTDTIGYDTGVSTLTMNVGLTVVAGDTVSFTVPTDSPILSLSSYGALTDSIGTSSTKQNTDGTTTITDTFTKSGQFSQTVTLSVLSNSGSKVMDGTDYGTTTKQITWTVNGTAQTPLSITQTISPSVKMTVPTRTEPSATTTTSVTTGTDYVYEFNLKVSDGAADDTSAGRILTVMNTGGATVTIPVPSGFLLNEAATTARNGLPTGYTISQPDGVGGDIVIAADPGVGTQFYESPNWNIPYYLIGQFVAGTVGTVTAANQVIYDQKYSDGSDTVYTGGVWSETLTDAAPTTTVTGSLSAAGNSSAASDKLVLDNDTSNDPAVLSFAAFSLHNATAITNGEFTITIPDGIDATGIKVPASGVTTRTPDNNGTYLPDTTTWMYTLTLADGTTQTGTVEAGGTITVAGDSAIRTAVLQPDVLAVGANAQRVNPIQILGTLSSTFDDGSAVTNGTQLKFTYAFASLNDLVSPAAVGSFSSSFTETVTTPTGFASYYKSQSNDHSTASTGNISLGLNGGKGQTTDQIYEPVLYFVLPKSMIVRDYNFSGDPVITTYTTADGRTGIKVDYTGTGEYVYTDARNSSKYLIDVKTAPDAVSGTSQVGFYITSPTTPLINNVKVTDLSLTDGDANAVEMNNNQSNKDWVVDVASGVYPVTMAQGNADATLTAKATADERGDSTMTYTYTLVNQQSDSLANAAAVINLPTTEDSLGSTFTFALDGPITVPTTYSASGATLDATVLYAITLYTPVNGETQPNIAAYLTADQIEAEIANGTISGWDEVRSVYISFGDLPVEDSTGRVTFTGNATETLTDIVQKTAYLQTYTYYSNSSVKADTAEDAASITVTGTSTVTSRFHYVDTDGNDQYVDLSDLTQTLNDGKDKLTQSKTTLTQFSATDQALVPTGYHLAGSTVIDGTGDGVAVPGSVSQAYFDGDIIQYELVEDAPTTTTNQVTKTIEYVDKDGKSLATPYTDTSVVLTQSIDAATGSATYTPENATLGYQALPEIIGYHVVNAPHDATADTIVTFGSTNFTVTVVYAPDELKQVVDNIVKTVTYVMEDGTTAPEAQSIGTSIAQFTNASTGVVTYSPASGEQTLAGIDNPVVTGYSVDTEKSDAGATASQTVKFGDADQTYTVYYKKDAPIVSSSTITKTVHYVDQDNNSIHADYTTEVTIIKSVDAATGVATYEPASASLGYQDNPVLTGYHVVTSPAEATSSQTVEFGDADVVYTVVYNKDTPAFAMDTVTKTVHYVDQDGETIAPDYTTQANFTEITDPVTGEKSYGPETGKLGYQENPVLTGYHVVTSPAEATSTQTVKFGDADEVYTVVYNKDTPAFAMDSVTKTVHYVDQDGNTIAPDYTTQANFTEITDPVTGEKSYGPETGKLGYQENPVLTGYHVVTSPAEATSSQTVKFGDADEVYTVVYNKDTPAFAMDTVTKTVHYVDQDGASIAPDYTTQANFTEITDPVTGEKSYGPETGKLSYQENPVLKGYHVVTSPAEATSTQTVKFGDTDETYTVVYNKDTPAFAMDTVTKTVHYVDQDGASIAPDYTTQANFTEITDPVTGEKSYGPETGKLSYQENPVLKGYHVVTSPAEATSTQTVKFGDADETYTVVYNKDTPAFAMDTVTKTVHYVDQDGETIAPDYTTQANFTEVTDPVTGEKSYGPETGKLGYQDNPVLTGYHVVTSPAEATSTQTVKFGDADESYTVVYNKDTPAFAMDSVTKTVHYVDQDGASIAPDYTTQANFTEITDPVTGEKSYGPETGKLGYQDNPVLTGYHVVTSPAEATSTQTVKFGDADEVYTVVYNKDTPAFAMDTVTKTVHYVDQDGNTIAPDYTTQANFTEVTDPVTGEKSYGPETGKLDYQDNPVLTGYHVVTSPAEATSTQTVKFGDEDEVYTVVYNKDTPAFAMDSVTKTVHYVNQDGETIAPDYTAQANFTEITDPVTGEKSYGPETGKLDYQDNPVLTGYHVVTSPAEATSTQTVKFGDEDEVYTVVYNKDTPAFAMDSVTKTVHYVDQDGNTIAPDYTTQANFTEITDPVTGEKSYGPETGKLSYQENPILKGYHVVTSPAEATSSQTVKFGDADETYTVVYNKDTPAFAMDSVTKTVHYVDQDGNTIAPDYTTQANFTEITDPVTGEKSYGPETGKLGYQDNPVLKGYHVVTSPAEATSTQTVKFGDADESYTVVYNKDTPAFAMDSVTKTVHYVDQDGKTIAPDYTTQANFTEITDPVTGEKSYGPETGKLGYQENPTIKGYHVVTSPAEATSTQTVKFGDADETYTVIYEKDAVTDDGGTPTTPSENGGTTTTTTTTPRVTLPDTSVGNQAPQPKSSRTSTTTSSSKKTTPTRTHQAEANVEASTRRTLPSTGDRSSTLLAVLGAGLLSLLGMAELRRKHHE